MHTVQLTRAEERRILKAGELEEVAGGELRLEKGVIKGVEEEKRMWRFWRQTGCYPFFSSLNSSCSITTAKLLSAPHA